MPSAGQGLAVAPPALRGSSGSSGGQGLVVTPSLTLTEMVTDNRDTRANNRQWDSITQISPGISLRSRGGPLQGSLSYTANGLVYARESTLNTVQHSLSAAGQLTLFDGRFGITGAASAGQQQVSAFGTQTNNTALNSGNQAQTYSYSLSPYLTGMLLGQTQFRASLSFAETRSEADAVGLGDSTRLGADVSLSGRQGQTRWMVNLSRQVFEQGDLPREHNGRALLSLNFTPDPEWQASLRLGRETEDIRTGQSAPSTNWGYGVTWLPGPRTSLRFETDRRFFGRSRNLAFSHRMARTIWTLSDSSGINRTGQAGRAEVSLYDALWALSTKTDPVERDLDVRTQLQGRDPDQRVFIGGFLTSSPTIERRRQASVTYQGLRASMTLSVFAGTTTAFGAGSASGDLANGPVDQSGFTASWSHRLTPDDTVALTVSEQRTEGGRVAGRVGNDLRSLLATWTARLGQRANGSVTLRHSRSEGDLNPYTESAIIGSLRMQF